jgi:predicted TIM-barrel fold metal-dependent hydrolase
MTLTAESPAAPTLTDRIPVVDVDVHPSLAVTDATITDRLPARWQDYLQMIGIRNTSTERAIVPQRKYTHRLDAIDPSGRPAVIPSFTRGQLLDEFDMSGVVLGDASALNLTKGNTNFPAQLGVELTRAYNDAHRDVWLADDPRFYSSINVLLEDPAEAVQEVTRCKDGTHGDRFVQVLIEPRSEYPIGNPKYWPLFEVCEHYGLPLGFHTSPGRRMTACGTVNYYFEWHTGFPLRNYTLAASMIFEGVFERFPALRVALIEQAWSWAVPYAWRLDHSWNMLRREVPHLQRKPSEHLAEHFFFATQPMEEPEDPDQFESLLSMFHDVFGTDHLMFSSDYPHWDSDSPYESVPGFLPESTRRKILGENAGNLYGIPLLAGTGVKNLH